MLPSYPPVAIRLSSVSVREYTPVNVSKSSLWSTSSIWVILFIMMLQGCVGTVKRLLERRMLMIGVMPSWRRSFISSFVIVRWRREDRDDSRSFSFWVSVSVFSFREESSWTWL